MSPGPGLEVVPSQFVAFGYCRWVWILCIQTHLHTGYSGVLEEGDVLRPGQTEQRGHWGCICAQNS